MSEKNKRFKHTIKGKWATIIIETNLKGLPSIIQDAYDNAINTMNTDSKKNQCEAEKYGDDCNKCCIKTPYLHRVAYSILFKLYLYYKVNNEFIYRTTQSICPNLTCCPECRMDDFTHVEGCKFENKLYKEISNE